MSKPVTADVWRGRNVFVTGHTGFTGTWMCLTLLNLGAKVTGYSLAPPTTPSFFDVADLEGKIDSQIADLRERDRLNAVLKAAQPEVVIHLAAQPLVREAFHHPLETLEVNVIGTANVLDAMRQADSVRAGVMITTDKVYNNVEWPWPYRETDGLGGKEPYGVSKACCEWVVDAWRHSYFQSRTAPIAVATARAGNLVGGGDWATDRLIPDAMRAFSGGVPLQIRNPAAVRPWQHAMESVRGYLILAERLLESSNSASEPWNFGPPPEASKSVNWIADRLVALWGGDAAWHLDKGAQPYEARHLTVDSTKASQQLGWTPVWNIETTLERTVEWYRCYYQGGDIRALSQQQIEEQLHG